MGQEFDAIVVGAGPAGSACGYSLAKEGLEALIVERGAFAGAKNTWGGAFYGPVLSRILPDFWKEAPVERPVSRHRYSLLSGENCVSVDYSNPKFNQPPYNGFTMFRAKFDNWFASKAQEAGAVLATGLQADDLLWDGGKVAGIKAGGDEIPAKVVVACDGVNSMLAQKAGLRKELKPKDVKQGVKEVLQFPPGTVAQRFNLQDGGGMDWEFIGDCTRGMPGGAFIYTNKDSLSVGVVVSLAGIMENGIRADDLLEDFKKHPSVAGLIEGGELAEYSAHLIPVSGMAMMPSRLYADGFLIAGDAAALVLGTGLALEGANFAMASGIAAASAVVKAKQQADFSAQTLSFYQELLEGNFVLQDLKTHRLAPHFLENTRIYTAYPKLACGLAERIFTSDGNPRKKTWELFQEEMKGNVSFWQIIRDLLETGRAI
jgi:electron transfer flavoprotein-quinone oxidoreductase